MNSKDSNSQVKSNEMSLKELILKIHELFRYLLARWPIILFFGILGGILGFTYAYFKKPIYTATTTFVLEENKEGGLGSMSGLASIAGIDIGTSGGGIFQGDNILELYKSRIMIEKALLTEIDYQGKKQLLVDHYIDFNKLRVQWAKNPELKNILFSNKKILVSVNPPVTSTRLQDSVLGTIVADIRVNYLNVARPDKKLSVIKTTVSSQDEFFAKAFNEQIVENVNDFYIQTKTKKSLQNVTILQQKADSVRAAMNGAIYTAAAVADATPNLNPTRQIQRIAPVQRSQFSAETNKAILEELVKNLEMSKMTLRKETPLIQVVDEPVFPLESQKLAKSKGIMIGGVFSILVIIFVLVLKKMYRQIIEND